MTKQESLEWVASLFEEPPGNIRPETERSDILAWDSLGMLTLMAGLNEKFDIVMSAQELQGLRKVGDILQLLRSREKLSDD